jgi:hypothetical protein
VSDGVGVIKTPGSSGRTYWLRLACDAASQATDQDGGASEVTILVGSNTTTRASNRDIERDECGSSRDRPLRPDRRFLSREA